MNTTTEESALTTADLAASAHRQAPQAPEGRAAMRNARSGREEALVPLFPSEMAGEFRSQWDAIQSSFVDDPRDAVKRGDELVAQVIKSLAESFASERARLEGQLEDQSDGSTEDLRLSLRRYRSFFERLLAL